MLTHTTMKRATSRAAVLLPEECLELLDKLREMDSQCVIEWPEGERFKVSYAPLQPSSFHLSINSAASWFELNGEVSINEKTKMKIADLMGQLDQAKGNFIRVGDDEYVRISSEPHVQSHPPHGYWPGTDFPDLLPLMLIF